MNCCTSSYAPRFLAVAAIAVLVVALSAVPAHAQILNFTAGFSSGQLCPPPTPTAGCLITVTAGDSTNNGGITGSGTPNVPIESTVLQLTQNLPNQRGAAWFNTPQQVAGGFGVEFQFQIFPGTLDENTTGDGFAFVIQNSSSGLAAIGGFGGGIGYGTRENEPCDQTLSVAQHSLPGDGTVESGGCAAGSDVGIPKSVAIEFDTYTNSWDFDNDHVAIQSCGTLDNLADHDTPCLIARSAGGFLESLLSPINLSDGLMHYVQIVYLPYSATCPTESPCPNLSVYIDPALNGGAPVLQAHVDLNNPCTAAGCPAGTILNSGAAYVGFTAATRGAQEEADILNFTFSPSVTMPLQGSGVTNSFVFPALAATYNVTYPADVPVTNTTMTITPTVLPPADCNKRVNVFGEGNNPTCTTFPAAGSDAVIFDVACAMGTNQTQGEACPTTTGFNPLSPSNTFHSGEDITNIVIFNGTIPAGVAPQFLTATEGTNNWVPIGTGFNGDCCTKGGGTNNYQSQMVLADFPGGASSPFAIPPYTFNGFTPPVTNQGNNVLNVTQAGQTVPLKWQLNYPATCPTGNPNCGYNGGPVTNSALAPAGYVTILAASGCAYPPGDTPTTDDTIPVDDESQTGLMNQGGGFYTFGWKTLKSFATECLTVTVDVGDGVQHNADFLFKK